MTTPEQRRAAWTTMVADLEGTMVATRENARVHRQEMTMAIHRHRSKGGNVGPMSLQELATWDATYWAADRLLTLVRGWKAPEVPRDDETGQSTIPMPGED